ncbi:MAG: LysR family transcriptional regulator [Janthinobacterium lividum]
MDKFREMLSFVAVVDAGSFVGAATALSTSKAAVSRHVADLEQRLGVRLLHRTTRKLSLTDDGQAFHHYCSDILASINEAETEISSHSAQASGLLRISAPVTFGNLHLATLWAQFLDQHRQITLDIALSDQEVDLVRDNIDLAIRISRAPHPTLIGRQLASTTLVLCASPAYLARRGTPRQPSDLLEHDIISYSYWSQGDEWKFEGPQGMATVKTRPRLRANSGDTCRAAALQHQGVILQPSFIVGPDLHNGSLVRLMPDYRVPGLGIHAVYTSRKHLPLKLRYLIDFLVAAFRHPPWD